jgi:hypothetical protein
MRITAHDEKRQSLETKTGIDTGSVFGGETGNEAHIQIHGEV